MYRDKLSMVNETYQCPAAGRMELLIRSRADVFVDVMENRLKGQAPERDTGLKWDHSGQMEIRHMIIRR